MAEGMMSPSDVAVMMDGRGNDGWGNGMGFMWIFALLILANGGWGGNWGNNGFQNAIGYENLATSNEVQRGFDNQNSMANEREILAAVKDASYQNVQNANQNTQYITGQVMDKYNELERDIYGIATTQQAAIANQNQCCCDTKMLISETAANQRYESAMQNNATIQAIREEGNATRSMIQNDKIEALQQKVNNLELQNAMNGVVRYPQGLMYSAGQSPFCTCGWNNGCCGMAA